MFLPNYDLMSVQCCYCFLFYRFWESFGSRQHIRDSRGEGANPLILWTSSRGGPHKKLLFDHMMDGFHVLLPKTLAIKLIEYRFFKITLARLDYEYSPTPPSIPFVLNWLESAHIFPLWTKNAPIACRLPFLCLLSRMSPIKTDLHSPPRGKAFVASTCKPKNLFKILWSQINSVMQYIAWYRENQGY